MWFLCLYDMVIREKKNQYNSWKNKYFLMSSVNRCVLIINILCLINRNMFTMSIIAYSTLLLNIHRFLLNNTHCCLTHNVALHTLLLISFQTCITLMKCLCYQVLCFNKICN